MNTTHTSTTPLQHIDDHLEPRRSAQLPVTITQHSPPNEDLLGVPPTTFDGDRSKMDCFLTEFCIFCILNDGNPVITNPKRKVALALNYIRGPKVAAWVSKQLDALSIKANHAPTHADTNEALWEDFQAEFKRAFTEPSWKVLARLENLQMVEDEVEMYIATFENLVRRAERQRESRSMVDCFLRGLPIDFLQSIVDSQDTIPNTIDKWQSAARQEVQRQALMKLYHLAEPKRDADATWTGVIRRTRMSKEERIRLMAEGRCFECKTRGHLARDCPKNIQN